MSKSLDKFAKSISKRLPGFKKILNERDQIRISYKNLQSSFAQLKSSNAELQSSHSIIRQNLDEALKIPDELVGKLNAVESELHEIQKNLGYVPPGHYYSPIPSQDEIRKDEKIIFADRGPEIPGIKLTSEELVRFLDELSEFYKEMPFEGEKKDGLRYYFKNDFYSYSDAIFLYSMIRRLRPQRIIEVGSGYSSAVILDTNDLFFNGQISTLFIEPYPMRLHSLLKGSDEEKSRILTERIQDVSLKEFDALEENDILFIDSTHISKINSDVNFILFEILPRLKPGVYIHFHDIFFPFEYPITWAYEGRAWNEAYLLRAFLQYNSEFRVVAMNSFLHKFHLEHLAIKMPLCTMNPGGSIWLRKN
jgi:predicted O-methyltransferase YrrM